MSGIVIWGTVGYHDIISVPRGIPIMEVIEVCVCEYRLTIRLGVTITAPHTPTPTPTRPMSHESLIYNSVSKIITIVENIATMSVYNDGIAIYFFTRWNLFNRMIRNVLMYNLAIMTYVATMHWFLWWINRIPDYDRRAELYMAEWVITVPGTLTMGLLPDT